MKKCILTIVAVLVFSFALTSIGGNWGSSSDTFSDVSEGKGERDATKNLVAVEFTLPAEYMGDSTQEELDEKVKEYGFVSITLNEDGSADFVMLTSRQRALVDEMREEFRTTLENMIGSEEYPNITAAEINFDFNEIIVTTSSTELDANEIAVVSEFAEYIELYNYVSGDGIENVHVEFVNADSGEVIEAFDEKITTVK